MADNCCNGCGTCNNCLGTPVKAIYDYMSPLIQNGEPLAQLKSKTLPLLESYMFDVVHFDMPDGTTRKKLVFKSFRGDSSTYVFTDENCQVTWYENCVTELFKTKVATAATASNTIVVSSVSELLGVNVGSQIQVSTATGLLTVTVSAVNVNTNTITLGAGETVTVAVGDCVERVGYIAPISCTGSYDNKVSLPSNRKAYKAPFRLFVINHDFELCELNLDRLGGESSTRMWLEAKKQVAEELFMNQILHALFFDDGDKPNQLRGLFPALKKAYTQCGIANIYDFDACCDPTDVCDSMDKQIQTLLKIIKKVTESGAYTDDRKVTVQINSKQWELLTIAEKYFYENQAISRVDMDGTGTIDYAIPSIKYAGFLVEFKYNPFLDKFSFPMFFIMPSDAMQIVQRAISGVDANMNPVFNSGKLFSGDTPMVKYIDETPYTTNRLGYCVKYLGYIDLAVIWRFVDTCAYMIGKNFAKCVENNCGDTCAQSAPFNIIG